MTTHIIRFRVPTMRRPLAQSLPSIFSNFIKYLYLYMLHSWIFWATHATAWHPLNETMWVCVCVSVHDFEWFAHVCIRDQHNKLFRIGEYFSGAAAYHLIKCCGARHAALRIFRLFFPDKIICFRLLCASTHSVSPQPFSVVCATCVFISQKRTRITGFHYIIHRTIIARVYRILHTSKSSWNWWCSRTREWATTYDDDRQWRCVISRCLALLLRFRFSVCSDGAYARSPSSLRLSFFRDACASVRQRSINIHVIFIWFWWEFIVVIITIGKCRRFVERVTA